MKTPKVEEIDEARSWGRALVVNGVLVTLLVMASNFDGAEAAMIFCTGIAMIWIGKNLCRLSDEVDGHQISKPKE